MTAHGSQRYDFASDNNAGIAPEAWAALEEARHGFVPSYGNDDWTTQACDLIREIFACDCQVFFTFNGTAANSLALASMCQSYHSILCHEHSHVETDECGAPEFFSNGTKVLVVGGSHAKIDPAALERQITRRNDVHYPKPRVVSLTQTTEMGTIYSPDELSAIHEIVKRHGLRLHMDGARFANAVAALGVAPAEITWRRGVDVLCFGGTKQGMPVGDAVVFFNKQLAAEFEYRCKQAGQLASKMRFLAAPWVGMLRDGAWLRHAKHANACARKLGAALANVPGVELAAPVQANAVFPRFPEPIVKQLREKGWIFYTFIGSGGARLMCSWQTTQEGIDQFLADVRSAAGTRS
jgi:threonine aldolase